MSENLKNKFLDDLTEMINQDLLTASKQIQHLYVDTKGSIADELSTVMNQIWEHYQNLMREGQVGNLNIIYISYLRSSILDGYPTYRIDFYDEMDCLSMIECSGMWEFKYVFSHFDNVKNKIEERFLSQNKIRKYEVDNYIFYLHKKFHDIAATLIPELITMAVNKCAGLGSEKDIEIRLGELYDETENIFSIDNNKVLIC